MMKFIVLLSLCAVAFAGYSHGHGGYGHGHGGHGGGHGGWGWRQYHGWASVNAHQTPHSYNYGLQEQGKGYSKYIWQGADAHHSHPVKGYGHGYGYH